MQKCPTGWDKNDAKRQCIATHTPGDVISSINFLDSETQWPFMGTYGGRYEGPLLNGRKPVLLANRGLYFDGHDDYMRLYDIRFNYQLTLHAWIYNFDDNGFVFSLETASPCEGLLCGDNELAVKFAVKDNSTKIMGVWDKHESGAACACAFLNAWKILHFRFESYDSTGAT
jgi:hypothetical protein